MNSTNKKPFLRNTQTGVSTGRSYLTGIPRYPLSGLRFREWRHSSGYTPEAQKFRSGYMPGILPGDRKLIRDELNRRKTDTKGAGSAHKGGAGGAKYEALNRLLKKRDYWQAIKEKKPPVYDTSIANYDDLYETACRKLPEIDIQIAGILSSFREPDRETNLRSMPRVLM